MNIAYIQKIKPYINYTNEEIINLLNLATNQFEYDYIIDRLYFTVTSKYRKHLKNRCEYSVLTATMLNKRRKRDNITSKFYEGKL